MEKEKKREESTKLVKIKNAIARVNHYVNLIGIVIERREPKRCSNHDWICTVRIVDETYSSPGLTVNVFSNTLEELPHVNNRHDMILFTRIKMKAYDSGNIVNAACNKLVSSFALYGCGSTGNDFVCYQHTSNFHEEEHYKSYIDSLGRLFASGSRVDKAMQSKSCRIKEHKVDRFSFLREIKEGKCFHLVCKILYANEDMRSIFVWDGTDAHPAPILAKGTEEDQAFRCLSVHTILPRDILLNFPTIGTILRVSLSSHLFHQVKPGEWVKLYYILCEVDRGSWVGKVTNYTKVHLLAQDDCLVEKIMRIYEKRKSSKLGHLPFWSFPSPPGLTETDYDSAPFVTLMDIITFPKVTYKYRCIVRAVAAFPWQVCSDDNGHHRVMLTLEDPTATIEAFLCDKDAEYFWGVEEEIEEEKEKILKEKWSRLLGSSNPPWIECCIRSYYTDKANPWHTRFYRIFATRLL